MRLRAIHNVEFTSNPVMVPTCTLDDDGRVRMALRRDVHKPGSIFVVEDLSVVRRLLEAGAVEVLDPGYEEMVAEASAIFLAERSGVSAQLVTAKHDVWPKPVYSQQFRPADPDELI